MPEPWEEKLGTDSWEIKAFKKTQVYWEFRKSHACPRQETCLEKSEKTLCFHL